MNRTSAAVDLEQAKQLAVRLAKKAGNIHLKHWRGHLEIHKKADRSLVTDVDIECQKLIIKGIKEKYPYHSIVAEESGVNTINSDYAWYVDPLDGTSNYIHGIELFGVMIALTFKGMPQMGVIYLPRLKEIYTAITRKGAFLNGKKIAVSKVDDIKDAMIFMQLSMSKRDRTKEKVIEKLRGKIRSGRDFGASSFEIPRVARGDFDAVVAARAWPFDSVAGALLVEEAGGKVTNFAGEQVVFGVEKTDIILSNGRIHGQIIKALK